MIQKGPGRRTMWRGINRWALAAEAIALPAVLLAAMFAALLVTGCEETQKQAVRVRPPAAVPQQQLALPSEAQHLPYPSTPPSSLGYELIDRRPDVYLLMDRMRGDLDAGKR